MSDDQNDIENLKNRVAVLEQTLEKSGAFKSTVVSIFQSKKALAALAAIAIGVSRSLGWNIPEENFIGILSILGVYITGQGIADHGKEKAKIETR